MKDNSQQRDALFQHLEAALALTEELAEPATGYLIECAIDQARSSQWGLNPSWGSPKKPKR